MTAMAAMTEMATAMVTAMAMMLLPPPTATILMTTTAAFEDSNWTMTIGQQQWGNNDVRWR
jgi:hypothetical protein